MSAQHTPGPWKSGKGLTSIYRERQKDFDTKEFHLVAIVTRNEDYMPNEQSDANARLIASAPDLLAGLRQTAFALESVLMLAGGSLRPMAVEELGKYLAQAKAAIAKAEGSK